MENVKKELARINRIARLYSITTAYDYFTKRSLYGIIANSKNDYMEAEKWADFSNWIFGDVKRATPQDFIHDRDEMTDKSIDYHEKYINILALINKTSNSFGLNSKTVDAFCKNVEHGNRCFMLKSIGHVQYPHILSVCINYMSGNINIDEFRRMFVWVGFSMKKLEPVNIKQFVRKMRDIGGVYREIEEKQNNRLKNKIA